MDMSGIAVSPIQMLIINRFIFLPRFSHSVLSIAKTRGVLGSILASVSISNATIFGSSLTS